MKAFEMYRDKMILKCLGNIYTNLETILKVEKKVGCCHLAKW